MLSTRHLPHVHQYKTNVPITSQVYCKQTNKRQLWLATQSLPSRTACYSFLRQNYVPSSMWTARLIVNPQFLPVTSTTNTSAYAINCFHIHIRQYHLKKLTNKKKKRRKHERGSKNLPSNALVSPCLCDGLVSVINMGFFFSGWTQSMSGFQSHCRSALSVVWRFWCCSVVSSCDGSGVGCFCCRVWRSDVAVGLHWELLQGVCRLLHSVTLLWNTENVWLNTTVLLYWNNLNQDFWGRGVTQPSL